ncbi:MAG: serine/threonine-protein kinase [Fuerstiella sp.]
MSAKTSSPAKLVGSALADRRYRILSLLGEGSMAFVYKAYDNRLDTKVVIKVPKPERLASVDFMQRFRRESQLMVQLTHPNIVQILDVGEHMDAPFVVMKLLAGGTLKEQFSTTDAESRKLSATSLKHWVRDVSRALDFVHTQNIVHRDIKPANILFDGIGNAFLSDFGLTKIIYGDHRDYNSEMTAAGFIVGTPNYVAPEIILGMPYDGRADQYSLGITIYQALSGSAPMQGASSSATMVNQTRKVLPLLSDLSSKIPIELALAVGRAISKNPNDRFDCCGEFANAIQTALQERNSGSSPGGTPRAQKRQSVNRSDIAITNEFSTKSPPPRRKSKVTTDSSPRTLRSQTNTIPCPKCKILLPVNQNHAGRRERCIHCNVALRISQDLTTLTRAGSENKNSALARSDNSSTSEELFLGEKLFFWNLSRPTAMVISIAILFLLIGVTIYLTLFLNNKAQKADLKHEIEQIKSLE